MNLSIVRLLGVDKIYGTDPVLRNIQFSLNSKDRILLYGPNGAGKTTLLKIVASLTPPTSGSISFYGEGDGLTRYRKAMSYLGHNTLLYPDLTGEENLQFFGALRGVPRDRCHCWLDKVGLDRNASERRVRFYSAGMKQRLAIARLLLHDPEVVLLDEPFNALDGSFVDLFVRWIQEKTVLLVTHQLDIGRLLATRAFEVRSGRINERPISWLERGSTRSFGEADGGPR